MKKGKIFWTTIATVIAITTIGISAVGATAGFAITSITASCDGSGLVYFTGTNPGFNLTLMDKHLGPSGPFLSSGISLSIPAGGTSPIAYQLDLSGWTGGPHYRVDSNYNTKSPSLNCGDDDATNTPTPSPTLTLTPTSTPTCEWWQQLLDWQCVDPTPTNTDTPSPTLEDIPTFTATASVVPDDTPTFTATASVAPDDTPTFTATASFVPDDTPTGTTAVCQEDYYWNGEYCVPDPLGCNRETGQIEPYFGESLPEGWGPVDDPVCNPVIASVTPVGESFGRTCDNSYVATFIRNLQNKGIYDPEKHYPEFEKICPDGAGSVLPRLWPWLVGAGMVYGLFAFLRRKMYATTKQ